MEFFDYIFLDNTIGSYLIVLVSILLVLVLRKILSRYLASFLFFFIHKSWKNVRQAEFQTLIVKPMGWLLVVVVSLLLLDGLNFPSQWRFTFYGYRSNQIVEKIGICIIIIFFIRVILKLVDFIALILEEKAQLTKERNDDQLIVFFRDFLKVFIVLIGVLLIIKAGFNQKIGSLLTGLSIVGAALALAAKESLENLIASFIIFFDKPFYVGDTLKVNNVTGAVEKIGLRSTRIRTSEKTLVTVPNKQMVDSIVDNHSMRSERRGELKLEISVKTAADQIEKLVSRVRQRLEKNKNEILKHSAFFTEFNKNIMVMTIEYYTIPFSTGEFNKLRQSLIIDFKKILDEINVDMPEGAAEIHITQGDSGPVPPPSKTII